MLFFGYRQRRRLVPWTLCLVILSIVSSIGLCLPINSNFDEDIFLSSSPSSATSSPASSSLLTSPQRKTFDQEIGSPSELAWKAWLLVENKGGGQSALDSSNILRRITPKSIFIAPERTSCQKGFSLDEKGGCKPDPINIDENAQRQFLLTRLNILYGKNGTNRKKPAEMTGPLQINIPFSLPSKTHPAEKLPVPPQLPQPDQKPNQESITNDRLTIPIVTSQQDPVQLDNKKQDAIAVVVYKVRNNTQKDEKSVEQKTTLSPGSFTSSTANKDTMQSSHVVPVAEIVDEANETLSGVVDYKIPISIKTALNRSDVFDQTKIGNNRHPSEKKVDSPEDSSPTVVLLVSPTKLPTTSSQKDYESSKIEFFDRLTTRQEPMQRENTTILGTEDETIFEADTTIQTVSPLISETAPDQVGTTFMSTEKSYTEDKLDETAYTDEESQTEPVSDDHEDYGDTADEVNQDDFSEGEDELLKPGEAGMMISSKHQELIRSKIHKQRMPTTVDAEETTSTTLVETTTIPSTPTIDLQSTFAGSDSTVKSDATTYTKEDITSTQMTEIPSTITTTDQFGAEETTPLATKPPRTENLMKSTTRAHPTQIPTTTIIDNRDKIDVKESLEIERDLVTEPEVIFSTQGSHGITTSYGRKTPTHPAKVMETPHTVDEFADVVSKTEHFSLPDFYSSSDYRRPKPPIIVNNEPTFFKNDGNIPSEFSDQIGDSSRPAFTDFRRIPTLSANDESSSYIRFPEQSPEIRSEQHSFVRFPSDEVNSIHNQDTYKDHLLASYHSRDEYNANSPTSTKSSVPVRQKSPSTYWRIPPPGLRVDRQHQQAQQQQQQAQPSSGSQRQQKQKPMLLRFWARMPLVRDLSFYPTTSHGSHNEPIGGQDDTHRLNSRFSSVTAPSVRRVNYYKEMSSHDMNRLLAQQLGQSAIGG